MAAATCLRRVRQRHETTSVCCRLQQQAHLAVDANVNPPDIIAKWFEAERALRRMPAIGDLRQLFDSHRLRRGPSFRFALAAEQRRR